MFWGLIMESGKRYTQTVERAFHLSMAVLELDPSEDDDSVVSLRLHFDSREFILCHLSREKATQVQLDLNFQSGDKIAFLTSGRGRVHLSGYLLETDEDEMDDMDEDDEDEDVSQEMRTLLGSTPGKRKPAPKSPKQTKKMKLGGSDEDDSDEEFDDAVEDSDVGSDEEAESEEDLDVDSSEEEAMVTSPKAKTPELKKKEKISVEKQQNRTPADKMQQQKKKTPNEKQQMKKSPEKPQTPTSPATPNGLQESGKKKKKKGQQDTPQSQRKVMEGGLMVEDVKVGNGPVAKPGRQVQVYYVGRLKQNNKQFDASTEGPGFKFRLARGEVIKGWDIGVAGMRVGGKRKIVCPPALAYGAKGALPSVPPHSTLVFEVELKSVS